MAEERSMVRDGERSPDETRQRSWPFRAETDGEDQSMGFPVDICETEDTYVLVGDLPGVTKEHLQIRLSENQLVIAGQVSRDLKEEEVVGFREIPGADFRRSFTLSDAVDAENIKAELVNGVLKVNLAKADHVKPREIEITG
jgi:HSP20 family molecular chaperone IbpA